MPIRLTSPRSELGRAVARRLEADDGGNVVVHLDLQPANSLLHDGRAWERVTPARILAATRNVLAANRNADFLVHAGYAFLRAAEQSPRGGEQLRPIVEAAEEAETMVMAAGVPACVVRLGYLYGPESRDLRAYRIAFRIGRPYWAGPKNRLQHHLHTADAATALLRAATTRPAGRLLYATDAQPASFADFGDHFAHLVGNPLPTHLPRISKPFARAIIADEHMQMLEIGVRGRARPQVPGFKTEYPDYRAGLEAVLAEWDRDQRGR